MYQGGGTAFINFFEKMPGGGEVGKTVRKMCGGCNCHFERVPPAPFRPSGHSPLKCTFATKRSKKTVNGDYCAWILWRNGENISELKKCGGTLRLYQRKMEATSWGTLSTETVELAEMYRHQKRPMRRQS